MKVSLATYVISFLLLGVSAWAQEEAGEPEEAKSSEPVTAPAGRLQLDTTSVTGNSELPKVLVIVPWKSPELAELTGRPLASLVEEVLAPVDPDVFRRQVSYYNALKNPDADEASDSESK